MELRPFIKEFEPLFEVNSNNHPKLLKEFLGSRVSLETMIILDELVGYGNKWKTLKELIDLISLKKIDEKLQRVLDN